ncbi:unnamed protein product [Phytophthora lilii]|uniref:Unnamed protein product n=1 Tax=Phytophthora lilii TaxID=2077276 RepID=A0A9W6TZB2_9STRA|nr:unnamed protein product [Phytophthora lilii]
MRTTSTDSDERRFSDDPVLKGFSSSRLWDDDGASPNKVDVCIQSDMRGNPAIRHGCDETTSTQRVDANLIGSSSTGDSADWRRVSSDTTASVADAATSSADGCKRLAPKKLAGSRAAGLHDEAERHQAGLDSACRRVTTTEENLPWLGLDKRLMEPGSKRRRNASASGACSAGLSLGLRPKQEPSAGQTLASTNVETLNFLTPTNVERMKSEAEALKQIVAESGTEIKPTLSEKSKKECLDQQSLDSLKSSPYYDILREHRNVLPDEIPAELPTHKGVQHEIDLVPGTKYCVTRQWPLPRDQVKAIDDVFESAGV